jgi:flavin-dependent dehydrogenase
MSAQPLRVAILGAGPAGAALALLLVREGADVTVFDDGRRPRLMVGESLVPAVNPILERLGMKDATAAVGRVKPGVSFLWSERDRFSFSFARFSPAVPPYTFNIPRPGFDDVLLAKAVAAGAHRVESRARLERGNGERELALAPEAIAAAPWLAGQQPDLIVDATGRARHAARVLGIPGRIGPRNDVAHFAHFENVRWPAEAPEGQVLISRLRAGWAWRIPLKDRLSVGIVLGREAAAALGSGPEERLERAIATDPWLGPTVRDGKRVTPVATYSNYQLISERGCGPGWVMVGDAFGFVDPMLSPGVYLALRSSEFVADALAPFARSRETPAPAELMAALGPYLQIQTSLLAAWNELVGYFYDGRMLALLRAGHDWMEAGLGPRAIKNVAQNHIERHVALQASGMGILSRYSRSLLRFLGRYGLRGVEPATMAIR